MGVGDNLVAKEQLTKEEYDKFIEDLENQVETGSKHLDKYDSWHFPFGKRIDIFQKYFGVGGAGLRIENRVELLMGGTDGKAVIGAMAEARIINNKGETVTNATRLGMKEDWSGLKDKFVEKAQQYALETALGYLGIRSSKDDEESGSSSSSNYKNSQNSKPQYNNQTKTGTMPVRSATTVPVANKPVPSSPVTIPVTPVTVPKPPAAVPIVPIVVPKPEAAVSVAPTAGVVDKKEEVGKKEAEGVKQVEFNPPVVNKDKGKVVFEKEDKESINELYFKSALPKEAKKKYFAIWTGECKHEQIGRFVAMFKAFEEAHGKNDKQAIQELTVLEGRGKMEVTPYNLNIVQRMIS